MKSKERGITLIALVVTIVVLIILASISIATLTGDNGIINQAQDAKEQTEISEEKEIVSLASTRAAGEDKYGNVTKENLTKELDNFIGKGKYDLAGDGPFTIVFKESGRSYIVGEDGGITQPTNPNIFKYTKEGYITGVKDEYIEAVTTQGESYNNSKKYASINNIKISSYQDPSTVYYLKEEVGTELYIPTEIEETKIIGIANNAFFAIYNLTKVIIPSEIKEIGDRAFYCCKVLESVELQKGLEKLGASCFENCFELNNIELPDSLLEIGESCFYQIGFNEIYIPQSVEIIGAYALPFLDKVYCEVDEQPEEWDKNWNRGRVTFTNSPVEWGVSR